MNHHYSDPFASGAFVSLYISGLCGRTHRISRILWTNMSENFKVLIIGGSVAGLTLALCLEKLEISYEILEQREDISPQVGASVGIMPNGALVLDQLGVFDAVERVIEPLEYARIRYPDGFVFQSQYPAIIAA